MTEPLLSIRDLSVSFPTDDGLVHVSEDSEDSEQEEGEEGGAEASDHVEGGGRK